MPMVMKNSDWMRTVANVSNADGVWFQNVSGMSGTIPLEIPEAGRYQVILVKMGDTVKIVEPKKPCIKDFIGYGRKFNPEYRSTAEIMSELREGEEPFPTPSAATPCCATEDFLATQTQQQKGVL